MKKNSRGFTTYQQTLFNKYEIDESYLQTRKQRRACLDLLEKIDQNQDIDEKKMIAKIASAFRGNELYKKAASCMTIAALLVTLQSTPAMAQAAAGFQPSAQVTGTLLELDNSVIMDEDSFLYDKGSAVRQEIKITSLHLVANKALKNVYDPLDDSGVLIDADSDVIYYPQQEVKNLTVIDTDLDDWETLRDAVTEGEILLLDGTVDPLEAILAKLQNMQSVDCLNIISHGSGGRLEFANGVIDSRTLAAHKDKWAQLSGYFSREGDIQLFGCNIAKGKAGKAFIEELAQITGADVAASINPTGAESKGGDWKLEAVTGDVAGNLPFTEAMVSNFLNLLFPTGTQNYNFSAFTDSGDTISNAYFLVSGIDNDMAKPMDISGAAAYLHSSYWGEDFSIKVEAVGTSLESFELEDLNLENATPYDPAYYSFTNVHITGHKADGTGTVDSGNITLAYSASGSSFSGWDNFDGVQLDYFVINARSDYWGAEVLMFNSFSVSNMVAAAPPNTAPTVSDSTKNGTEDTTMTFTTADFTGEYSDAEDKDLSEIRIVDLPDASDGVLKLDGAAITAGQEIDAADLADITFEPAADFFGNASFAWKASDGTDFSVSAATMTLNLAGTSDPPAARDHTFTTDEDVTLNGSLTGYAEDVDGDTLTYAQASTPTHGTVTVNSNGTFTYTPAANFHGTDSFAWSVSDGLASATAVATITVTAVNDAPTVSDNSKNGTEDTTMTFAAEDFSVGYSDEEGNAFNGILIVDLPDAATGVLKLGAANIIANQAIAAMDLGSITFVPAADFNGSTSFTWKAGDGMDFSASAATMTLNIAGTNDAPTAADYTFTTDEDTVLNDSLTGYAADVDGDTLAYAKVSDPTHGTLTVNTSGSFTYTPVANFNGTDSFTWSVSDGTASATATATITVDAVNDAPIVSGNSKNGTEDTTMTFAAGDFSVDYSDEEGSAFSGIKIVTLPDAAHGVLKLSGTAITANQIIAAANLGNITFVPIADFNGSASFTWKAGDGTDYSDTAATMTLNIAGTNDVPTAANHTFATDEDVTLNGSLTGYAEDVDGDTLTYAKASDTIHGTVTVNTDGSFTYTPAANFNGSDSFTWSVSDGTASATATATITVDAVNDAPTVSGNSKNGTEDTTMTFAAGDFSVDYSDEEGSAFSGIKIVTLPDAAHGVLKLSGTAITANQVIAAANLGNITFGPVADFNGSTSFTWEASDGAAYSAAATMTLNIAGTNDVPTAVAHTFTTDEDTVLNDSLTDYAADVDTGDTLIYAKESDPTNGSVTVNTNGSFTYTPVENFNGTDSFTWSVSDGTADSNTATATITVTAVNDAPTVSNNSKNGTEDTTMTFAAGDFSVGYSDEEGSAFSGIRIATLPDAAHGVLKLGAVNITANQVIAAVSLGNITFVPAADFNGSISFTWKAGDGTDYSDPATMTLSIAGTNDAPTAADHTFTTDEDVALNGSLTGYAGDIDGDSLIYAKAGDPSNGSVTVNADGTFTYTPTENFNGTDSFTWSVSDGTADSNTATATITVNAVNNAPTVSNNSKNGTEDTTMTFAAGDFSVGYSDVEGNAFSGIQIVTLPDAAHGTLKLNNVDIIAGQEIDAADLEDIIFVPVADFYGNASFTWKVSDGISYSASAVTMTLTIAGTDDAPGVPTNVTASAGDGQVTVTFIPPADDGGSAITRYIVTSEPGGIMAEGGTSPITVTGLINGTAYTFKVKAVNGVGTGIESAASNAVTPSSSDSSSGSNSPSTPPATSSSDINILVNGNTEQAATSTTTRDGDRTVTTVTIDGDKLEEKLQAEGNNAVVTIPVGNSPDTVVGQLNGQTVKNMENQEAILEIKTENVTYTLPASQIDISRISEQIGNQVDLRDITVRVTVSEPPQDTVKVIEDTADRNSYQIVVQPVQFEITCTSAGKTVEVSRFNAYVERTIAIPEGVDPGRITTGIILNPDGTFSHVPTQIVIVDGKYYAKISSLTDSTYSVIWNPKSFRDVETHWAKPAVNDMGSRLILNGIGNGNFAPEREITRAEFASILVNGLGLMRPGTGQYSFADVSQNNWYYDAVSIACENGLVTGMGNNMYMPGEQITREQAMVMVEKAMKLAELNTELQNGEEDSILQEFLDSEQISPWARKSAAICVRTGIITGKGEQRLAPQDYITRAEVAVIVQKLLQKSDLI
ncbi:MAG: tandem-95 repeat protein [Syntrophomonadaceae bacterium]|nr:tandem-95 repeat protein [Syntrophomonadaceae bacterium]